MVYGIVALEDNASEYKNAGSITHYNLLILQCLGVFFMGGIWLLEKEGLHRFEHFTASDDRICIAITFYSVNNFAILIVLIDRRKDQIHILALCSAYRAIVFNLIGLLAALCGPVNHYMIIVIFPTVVLSLPPVLLRVWNHLSVFRNIISGTAFVAYD